MLLWATDHAPGKADVIIISKVFDRSMADVIHQLYTRNYNIILATSFPPKDMTPLRQCAPPPSCKLLRQIFPDLPNASEVTSFCPQIIENCKNLIEELLQKGITEFLECDLYMFYRIKHGERLNYNEARFATLAEFLQVAVPGVNFRSMHVRTKPWVVCSRPGQEPKIPLPQETEESIAIPNMIEGMKERQSKLLSDLNTSTRIVSYGPLTMEEVKNWLLELVACGRADAGINLSLLGRDFEEHNGKKLNYKSLCCPTLTVLLSKFENLVQLERRESMVFLFPRKTQRRNGARPTMAENVPAINQPFIRPQRLFCPPTNCTPGVSMRLPCTSLPSIVQVPGQISIRKNIPTAVPPVPKFSMDSKTTMKPPAAKTVNTIIRPRKSAPPTPDVGIEPAIEVMHQAIANHLPDAGVEESYFECREFRLPKVEQVSTPSSIGLGGAHEAESPQISMTSEAVITPRTDPVRVASTAPPASSEIKTGRAGGIKQHLPSVDAAVPTFGTPKLNLTPDGEDAKQGTNGDAGNGKKFDLFSLQVIQEREAIKRTFQSVHKRLQEDFKRRKLAQQSVAKASGPANNIAK